MMNFVTKHPIITLLLGSTIVDGIVKVTRTIAYAVTGREGLAPNTVRFSLDKDKECEEDKDDEPTGDNQ